MRSAAIVTTNGERMIHKLVLGGRLLHWRVKAEFITATPIDNVYSGTPQAFSFQARK